MRIWHKERKDAQKRQEQETKKYATTEIRCQGCNMHICWCNDFDLNSSYFYCDDCKKYNKDEVESRLSELKEI